MRRHFIATSEKQSLVGLPGYVSLLRHSRPRPLRVIRVHFGCPGDVRLRGNLGSTGPPVLPVEGIGLDVIQASKPEPRIMRYELTDFEWAAIRSFLPNKPRGIPRVDDRRVLNGIFWVLSSGAPWRDLPVYYGPRTTCYNRFVRWRQAGVWTGSWMPWQQVTTRRCR